ncbi:MAG TPA: hypothetical protein VJ654_12660 [Noviherbaspirillum sp.]|nr:hypothetical protein [Noviherbaspirillum sp.]
MTTETETLFLTAAITGIEKNAVQFSYQGREVFLKASYNTHPSALLTDLHTVSAAALNRVDALCRTVWNSLRFDQYFFPQRIRFVHKTRHSARHCVHGLFSPTAFASEANAILWIAD